MGTPQVQTVKCQHCDREFTSGAPTLREAMENLFEAMSNHVRESHSSEVKRDVEAAFDGGRDPYVAYTVAHSPKLDSADTFTKPATEKKQSIADRIRQACQLSFDGNPKAIRSHLHGLRINLRNLATEVEKLEKEVSELRLDSRKD